MPKARDGRSAAVRRRASGAAERAHPRRRHRSRPAHRCVVDRGDTWLRRRTPADPRDLRIYAGLPLQRHVGLGQRAALPRARTRLGVVRGHRWRRDWLADGRHGARHIDRRDVRRLRPDARTAEPLGRRGGRLGAAGPVGLSRRPGSGPSTTVSDFAYYATACADRVVMGADTDAAAYLAWLQQSPFATSPAGSVYLSSAACHSWPLPPATSPPTAVPAVADFPVVMPAASSGPITPPSHAEHLRIPIGRRYVPHRDQRRTARHVRTRRGVPRRRRGRPPCPRDPAIDHAVDVPRRDRRTVAWPSRTRRPAPIRSPSGRPPSISSCSHT